MMDKFRTLAAMVGMTLIGPILMGFSVVCLIRGELPIRHSAFTAADHPILFYSIIFVLLYSAFKCAQISVMFAIGYLRGRSRR
ncbi:hypothetical protein B5P45_26915 [Phyllobacterium zundukense]|uniref:Uncharacterized protein n=1 Tax=Phyllobacterium zundukense TaxID=1867719 RepID=A0A2N9VQJ5_9HYPH|nr:hypothetical protein BLM14_20965 [Phyllobacterium zundukense]PIO41763.1 hypothetical protein B5P45_26915 [Phyllobacterium zundukense]